VGDRFQVQVYSDELGARKPNPAMVTAATDALGVAPADTWFVGDTLWRDTLCARRAGVGCAILVRSDRDRPVAEDGWLTPDVFLHTVREVHHLLAGVLGG
jgi:FMN phosphatase YigB (HAD superfamily)